MFESAATVTTRTTCPYCGVGCGVKANLNGERTLKVKGDDQHPANAGRLCSKGTALGNTFGLEGRLLTPKRRTNGQLESICWDDALDTVAHGFNRIISEHGPDAVAFYVSGQLLTEDYYAVNKLAKGYIGTANIDTNSRLCMSSAVAAHKHAFGADLVPGTYEDLELADLLVFSGHNAAWTHPVLYRRIEAREGQMRVCIDPKRTDTAKAADLHLMIKPQTDIRLWNGLCAHLIARNAVDHDFIDQHTNGFSRLMASLSEEDQSLDAIALDCALSPADVKTFYDAFLHTEKTVSLFSMGSNQSSQGVHKGLALINAHLLSGKIGKPGACPFSITGQPNAMGGREVGGLANMLAAHMDFDDVSKARVQRYWNSPTIAPKPGLKAVDMFEAIRAGKIKAIWIMATNPMVSMPDANKIHEALSRCELVVVSDVIARTDTLDMAHIQLPAAAWGEKDGTVTNSERVISRQRRVSALPGEVRPDWVIIAEVARRMNSSWDAAFSWKGPHEVFAEHAGLTAFENTGQPETGGRFLNLDGLTRMSRDAYNNLAPTRWPITKAGSTHRLFANGQFATPNRRARLIAPKATGPANPLTPAFPFSLNSARVRDHWHTMTRTALAPELNRHIAEPLVDIHPKDAKRIGIKDGRLACITTAYGEAILKARVTDDVREGSLSVPMHWTKQFAPFGRANTLINPAVDPISGQPEFKHTPATVRAYAETWHGFILTPRDFDGELPDFGDAVWRRSSHAYADCFELAGITTFDVSTIEVTQSLDDLKTGLTRRVRIEDGRLTRVIFIAPIHKRLPPRDWLLERFGDLVVDAKDRAALLIGRLPGVQDAGRIICACRSVGEKTILAAIGDGALTVEAIGEATTAGTACGSCRGELKQCLLHHTSSKKESSHAA
ncbi:molybdopterin-dependent oxidoreductase [Asticcacaulis sp. 201]|uniref:nitrate reductase n=1 Tax=Asticcacaulis sp. 201 TaxID=3028787 RepID=UPI002916E058|nr:molybdopterin-dependent oxidoreductase [Asticcacaulis sp. 201]MDV6331227.1 molybdopterin-dependent oxidoreductase [Asticcacaulis sp. 201]